jgi:glycosyltransferase involved in cell wall biosynthesis
VSTSPPGRIRLIYVIHMAVRWVAFEWIGRELDRERFELSYVLLNDGEPPLARYLKPLGVPFHALQLEGRADIPRVARALYRHFRRVRPHIVHTHFMNACLSGLSAARLAGVPIRLHTRHHAGPWDSWRQRPPWGRLYDRYNNALSTRVIAPSRTVQEALSEEDGLPAHKQVLIHHGFDLEALRQVPEPSIQRLREKYGLQGAGPVIGMVARYTEGKGVHHAIPAFGRLLEHYPAARLVLANARGPWAEPVRRLLATLPPGSYVEIPFEEEMFALYRLFDVFVHVPTGPRQEAFGQVYVEALAAGLPCVFTLAGIARELASHARNAWVVDFGSSEQIYQGMRRLLEDTPLRETLRNNGPGSVEPFGLSRMVRALEQLYLTEAATLFTAGAGSHG